MLDKDIDEATITFLHFFVPLQNLFPTIFTLIFYPYFTYKKKCNFLGVYRVNTSSGLFQNVFNYRANTR